MNRRRKISILNEDYVINNGVKIPKLALGTWLIEGQAATEAVKEAIKLGYRHIDTAQAYGNETEVGLGLRESGKDRQAIFVTTKLAAELKDYDSAAKAIDESLTKLGLDYIDLMIIHSPQPWKAVNQSDNRYEKGNLEAYRALEDAYKAGKLRAIGVSNFNQHDLQNQHFKQFMVIFDWAAPLLIMVLNITWILGIGPWTAYFAILPLIHFHHRCKKSVQCSYFTILTTYPKT